MADRTDQFNPYLQQRDAPDFTRATGVPESARFGKSSTSFLADAIEGVGGIISAGARAADELIKTNIEDEVREEVDLNRDAFIQGLDRESGIQNADTPPELKIELEKQQQLTQSRQNGRMSEVYYWAQMDAITRRMKNRYPGHKDFVDSFVSGLVGGTPANQHRAALMKELSNEGEDTIDKRMKKYEDEHADIIYKVFPEYFQLRDDPNVDKEKLFKSLQVRGAQFQAQRLENDVRKEWIEEQERNGNYAANEAERLAIKETNLIHSQYMQGIYDKLGWEAGDIKQMYNTFRDKQDRGEKLSAEDLQQVQSMATDLTRQFNLSIQSTMGQDVYKNLSPEAKSRIIAMNDRFIQDQISAFMNDKTGMMFHGARLNDALKVQAELSFMKDEAIANLHGAEAALGPNGAQALYFKNPELLDNAAYVVSTRLKSAAFNTTNPKSFTAIMKDSLNYSEDPRAFTDATEWLSSQIADIDKLTSPEAKAQLVEYIYGGDNDKVFELLEEKDRLKGEDPYFSQRQLFKYFSNDLNAQSLYKLKESNPEVWKKYKDWVGKSFIPLFKQELDDAKEVIVNGQYTTIQINPNTYMFEAIPVTQTAQPMGEGFRGGSAATRLYESTVRQKQAEATVNKLNTLTQGILGIAKQEGIDPMMALTNYMRLFGIDSTGQPVAPKQGNAMNTLVGAIADAIAKAPKAVYDHLDKSINKRGDPGAGQGGAADFNSGG